MDIEGYRIESEGETGVGVHWLRARQIVADAPVLLQLWDAPAAEARAAIRALAGLRHPGLATVLDVGEAPDGRTYAALAAPAGPSLRQQLAAGMDLDQALALLRRLALVLQYLDGRSALPACLDPRSVHSDAQGRPVLTRLRPTQEAAEASEAARALIRLFHEALAGHPPREELPQFPDYLSRWQPLLDLLAQTEPLTPARVLECLDRLQGRSTGGSPRTGVAAKTGAAPSPPEAVSVDAAQIPVPSPAAPAAAPAGAGAAAGVLPANPASAGVTGRERKEPARVPQPSAPANTPAAPVPQPTPAPVPARVAVAGAAAQPARISAERTTAPSKRLEAESLPPTSVPRALPEPATPAPPSRMPLVLAAALALPVLAGLAWWLLSAGAPAEATSVAPAPQMAEPSPASALAGTASARSAPAPAPGFQAPDPSTDWSPASPVELDLQALPTVEDPLERLLLYARTNVEAGRLIQPPGRNALDRYLQALRIEPDNSAARAGIADLGELCLRQAAEVETLDSRLQALACVERIAAAHPAGAPALARANELRRLEHDRLLVSGQHALAAWRSTEARSHFADALRLLPDSPAARSGASEAERQGKPGYRFRDPLDGDARGPELQVAGGLAWGRSEVSVEQFEAYWKAAGQSRFGADMPACRDRESMLRSSRRRDWRSPDFAQGARHPVACVNFAMAQHYAEWLSEVSGQRYRLPTLAEWRAVAGNAPGECRANFRDQSAARAWNAREASACDDGHAHTAPVEAAGETSGLLGLWGNLGEWLSDCEGGNCRQRLAAGGSWFSSAADAAPRGFAAEPGFTTIGFRVVREIPAHD